MFSLQVLKPLKLFPFEWNITVNYFYRCNVVFLWDGKNKANVFLISQSKTTKNKKPSVITSHPAIGESCRESVLGLRPSLGGVHYYLWMSFEWSAG